MRLISALFIIAIICQGTFAVSSKARQSKLLIEKVNASLSRSHLGRALKGMVQIASKLGYEYQDLYHAFDELKNSLLGKLDDENALFEEQSAYHSATVRQLEADLSQYQQDLADTDYQYRQTKVELDIHLGLLWQAQEDLEQSKRVKEQAEQELTEAEEVFQIESDEYASVRVVIAEAVAKLQEAQGHFENAQLSGFSFVQLKNTFVSFAQKVKTATEKLPAKHQLFIKPVILAMLAIKQDSGSSSIQLAINALNSLQAYFDQALSDLTNTFVSYKATLEGLIAQQSEIIDVLENQVIPEYTNQVNELQRQYDFLLFTIHRIVQQLTDTTEALNIENLQWEEVEARHNAFVERVNSEYDLVGQAERLIRTAQNNLEA